MLAVSGARVRSRFSREDGLARACFLIVAVWAVGALVCLTGTLLRAQSIDRTVNAITHDVAGIHQDTQAVSLLQETRKTALAIEAAAKPLSGQLGQVAASAQGIDRSAGSIRNAVASIDGSVTSIQDRAGSINTTAKSIDGAAKSIAERAKAIDGTVTSIARPVGEINVSAKGIRGNFAAILDVGKSIDARLVSTTAKADQLVAIAQAITADLNNILEEVGRDHGTPRNLTIHGHANSIDCSALLQRPDGLPAEPSSYCDK